MLLRSRSVVAKLKRPERSRRADDRPASLLPDLADQRIQQRLRSLATTSGQYVRAVVVEHEDSAVRRGEDRADRNDQLERRGQPGKKARGPERSDTPDHVSGRDRGQDVDLSQYTSGACG